MFVQKNFLNLMCLFIFPLPKARFSKFIFRLHINNLFDLNYWFFIVFSDRLRFGCISMRIKLYGVK